MSARPAPQTASIRLGLIGDNIARSRAPDLHRLAGELVGLEVTYERLIPRQLGQDFDEVFASCITSAFRGINVTYPYKELAARRVEMPDPLVREVGAVNTIIFHPRGAEGHNTDLSGFMAAYREAFGQAPPGVVALIGTGGVGRAIAFALRALGAAVLRLTDLDHDRAKRLATALTNAAPHFKIALCSSAEEASQGADGVVNCTPVGMVGYPGTPVDAQALAGRRWAFDAVYTPIETRFLSDATEQGLRCLSGFELFFHQGVHAFQIFTGREVPRAPLRKALADLQSGQAGKSPTHV